MHRSASSHIFCCILQHSQLVTSEDHDGSREGLLVPLQPQLAPGSDGTQHGLVNHVGAPVAHFHVIDRQEDVTLPTQVSRFMLGGKLATCCTPDKTAGALGRRSSTRYLVPPRGSLTCWRLMPIPALRTRCWYLCQPTGDFCIPNDPISSCTPPHKRQQPGSARSRPGCPQLQPCLAG